MASITSHHSLDVIRGTADLLAVASDDTGIDKLRFYKGSATPQDLIGEVPYNPKGPAYYEYKWNTAGIQSEKTFLIVQAREQWSSTVNDPINESFRNSATQ